MNSSGPSVMDWVEAEGCECTQFDSLCLRPSAYSKPRLCVNTAHGTNFTGHLLDAPCSNNNNNNLRNIGDPEDLLLLMMCAIIMIQMLIGLCLCGLTCKRICRAGHYSLQLDNSAQHPKLRSFRKAPKTSYSQPTQGPDNTLTEETHKGASS